MKTHSKYGDLVAVLILIISSVVSHGVTLSYEENADFLGFASRSITENSFVTIGPLANQAHPTRAGWGSNGSSGTVVYNTVGFLNRELSVAHILGTEFAAVSIDLAEYSSVFAGSTAEVSFIGTTLNGQNVSTSFVTDGVIDGSGGRDDFQSFSFPASFSRITLLELSPTSRDLFSFDNLVVVPVPEPTSASLISFVLAFPLVYRKR